MQRCPALQATETQRERGYRAGPYPSGALSRPPRPPQGSSQGRTANIPYTPAVWQQAPRQGLGFCISFNSQNKIMKQAFELSQGQFSCQGHTAATESRTYTQVLLSPNRFLPYPPPGTCSGLDRS